MIIICSADNAAGLTKALPEAIITGKIIKQAGKARVIIE